MFNPGRALGTREDRHRRLRSWNKIKRSALLQHGPIPAVRKLSMRRIHANIGRRRNAWESRYEDKAREGSGCLAQKPLVAVRFQVVRIPKRRLARTSQR